MRELKEREIQKQIIDYLELKKYLVVKVNNVGIRKPDGSFIPVRQKGISDLICLKEGNFIAIEVKNKNGRLTDNQVEFLDSVEDHGGTVFVARSLDEVMSTFK